MTTQEYDVYQDRKASKEYIKAHGFWFASNQNQHENAILDGLVELKTLLPEEYTRNGYFKHFWVNEYYRQIDFANKNNWPLWMVNYLKHAGHPDFIDTPKPGEWWILSMEINGLLADIPVKILGTPEKRFEVKLGDSCVLVERNKLTRSLES